MIALCRNVLAAAGLWLAAGAAHAAEPGSDGPGNGPESDGLGAAPVVSTAGQAPPTQELWLNPGFFAYHFQRDRHLNNRASGLGAEYRFSEASALAAGVYHNSNWGLSHYLGYYWRPLALGPVRFGAIAGAVNGYPGTRKGGWFPAVLPTATVEWSHIGLNVFYIPSYKDSVNGSLTFQLKLRAF